VPLDERSSEWRASSGIGYWFELGDYDALTSDFLGTSEGFFGSFEILYNGNPDAFAKKFGSFR
jgi:hypothetical protein